MEWPGAAAHAPRHGLRHRRRAGGRLDARAKAKWLRWQSPPLTTRGQVDEAWLKADIWSQNPGDEERRGEVAVTALQDWQIFYFRGDGWTNPLSSDATTSALPRALVEATGAAAAATRVLPDGVRLVLTLPPGQAISGKLTRDWVRGNRRRRQVMKARSRGAAILAAMLTVTLVATFAAAAMWQQWRGVEVEAAERSRAQSAWVLTGALDWSRLILREDARSGGADHLAEPWAVPLQEARLSTFLAADRSAGTDSDTENAFLSGQIIDLQSLLNVNNLLESGRISEPGLRSFARLFELLGLPLRAAGALLGKPALRLGHQHRQPLGRAGATDAAARGTAGLAGPAGLDRGRAAAVHHRAAGAHARQPQHRQRRGDLRRRRWPEPVRCAAPGGRARQGALSQRGRRQQARRRPRAGFQ